MISLVICDYELPEFVRQKQVRVIGSSIDARTYEAG